MSVRLLKNKGFMEERRTKNGLYAIGKFTTLESNKSLGSLERWRLGVRGSGSVGVAGAVTERLSQVRCKTTKSQISANRTS